jgi:PAS domain S-box-containing protein
MVNDGSAVTQSSGKLSPSKVSPSKQSHSVSHGRQASTTAPDRMIRTTEGRITAWSPGMQRRYGFTSEEAQGRISHQLLRTAFPQALQAIEATLEQQNSWSGGLIHHRADGTAVMTRNHWYVYHDADRQSRFVAEVHSNIAQDGSAVRDEFADVIAALAQELTEPLLAISDYVNGAQRSLQAGWPDLNSVREAIERASTQIARGADGMRLLRELADTMRHAG